MKIFKSIDNYINDRNFMITYFNSKINIKNYIKIIDFNNKEIIIKYDLGKVIISGDNLIINKMLEGEILIIGDINSIMLNKE